MHFGEVLGSLVIAACYVGFITISKYKTTERSNWGYCAVYSLARLAGSRPGHMAELTECINGRMNVYASLFNGRLFHFEILNFFIVTGSLLTVTKLPKPYGYVATVVMISISYFIYDFIKKYVSNKNKAVFSERLHDVVGIAMNSGDDFNFKLLYEKELLYYTHLCILNAIPAAGAWVILWLLLLSK
jgi:hypothetical protein